MTNSKRPPRWPLLLGLAGLLPQLSVVAVLVSHTLEWRFSALALGYAYAALIFSFLGGMWWGLGARSSNPPAWLWFAAVAPSLVALATAIPWAVGAAWPGPSLVMLAVGIFASLFVDHRLQFRGDAPPWWMSLRIPLSVGLGFLTLAAAIL